jgi:hypothetical protein
MVTKLAGSPPRIQIEVTNEGQKVFNTLTAAGYLLFDEKQRRLSSYSRSPRVGPNLFAVHFEDTEGLQRMNFVSDLPQDAQP